MQYYQAFSIRGNNVYPSDGGLSQNGDLQPPKLIEDDDMADPFFQPRLPLVSRMYNDAHIQRHFHPAMAMTMGDCLYFDEHAMTGDSIESEFTYNCSSL